MVKGTFVGGVVGAALLVVAGPGVSAGPHRAGEVKLIRVPGGGIQPQVAVEDDDTLHVVYYGGDPLGGDLYYVSSADDGETFSAPLRVNSQRGSAVAAGTIRGAQVALGREGRVHVAWNGAVGAEPRGALDPDRPADDPHNGLPMLYSRLDDAGTGFEPQRSLTTRTFGLDGGGSVAADGAGNVYVVWHARGRDSAPGEGGRGVWVAISRDDRRTFSPEIPAGSHSRKSLSLRGRLAWALAWWAGGGLGSAAGATVRVQVADDAGGQPVAARVSLWRGEEALLPPGFSSYSQGDERHILVPGDFALDLEPGAYRLRIERGLEYVPVELDLDVAGDTTVPVRLRRWIDLNAQGWYSADMHVHRDPADVPLILRAEDLNFVPTITTHVWSDDVSRPWPSPSEFPVVVEPSRLFTGSAQEVERIQGGPGAVILLARELPLPFTGYELFPPAAAYTRKVHEMGGFVEGDKLFWLDTVVNAALGETDFIELNCNHFLPRLVDTDLAPWSHWPMELGYRGPRGFALWMMDLYYRILNSGIELPLSAGSANGVKATPVGYNRVYVQLGEQRLDYPAFMRALKQGRSFSTNGPILELEVDGRYGPGDRIDTRSGDERRLRARARSHGTLETLQLIVNGEVVAEETGPDVGDLTLETTLRLDRSSWAALRAFEGPDPAEAWQPAPQVFAHTSPVYLLEGGQPAVVPESVQELLDKMDRLIAHTRRLEGFREESHREETLEVYREAREVLQRRLTRP